MQSTLVSNIDGLGTSELTVFQPLLNRTTVYVTSDRSAARKVTTTDHNTNFTTVESLDEDGFTTESTIAPEGTTTRVYNPAFEPISVTAMDGTTYTDGDLEIVEGTDCRIWEFKEAFKAENPTPLQLEILRATYGIDSGANERQETGTGSSTAQDAADEYAGGDAENGEFG